MRTASLLVFLVFARGILGATCTQDQCADAITSIGEINVGLQSRSLDCAKFIATIVTPNASIALITTSAKMEDYPYVPSQTTADHGTIPTYASYCTDAAAYSSACDCAGVTPSAVVAPTPTTYLYDKLPLCPNPALCAQGYNDASCGGGAGICIPGGGNDGSGFCVASGACGITCENNSDCTTGICLRDVCCGSTCYNPSVQLVTTWPPTPNKLVKKDFSKFKDLFSKFNGAKSKLLGSSKNKILGTHLPENPQPTNFFKGGF
ncbi:uncharacterized protein EAF01_008737 [Botrytis porri]|uniref:Uncharacterized protein n=1 Tax=Botrytis porri TaxID=87229 RepID=A0A4Z1KAS6_9HELO|nr:uncharacterized protein EAF01_008737 [Botrytis porri]KAF7897771.1 hypothetical protein EAF01_008737 [Botrytis porri]TGO83221.1 hypothetical protein BPOR_0682g00030 [Botrytis porri]